MLEPRAGMASGSDTVRAARLHRATAQPLQIEEVELPAPGADEVRVELHYGGVNPIDRYNAEGQVDPDGPRPRTLGGEAAGEVDGRPVLVAGEGLGFVRDGVWAQAAVVPREAVVERARRRGLRAGGGDGDRRAHRAQLRAHAGARHRRGPRARAGGVGRRRQHDRVAGPRRRRHRVGPDRRRRPRRRRSRAEGADRVLVGGPEEIAGDLAEFEPTVVFDLLGDGFVAPVVEAMAPRGRIVALGVSAGADVTFNMRLLYRKMLTLLGYGGTSLTREERRPGLQAALEAVRAGELRVRIDASCALEDVNEAFQRLVDRRVQGKLLLDLS